MDAREKGTKDHPDAVFHGPSAARMPGHPAHVPRDTAAMPEIHAPG
jgi:hypothetical protein